MSDAFYFGCGLVTMGAVWIIHDIIRNPYMLGYVIGVRDGIQEAMNDFPSTCGDDEEQEEEQDEIG